jgi:hypothetical protein
MDGTITVFVIGLLLFLLFRKNRSRKPTPAPAPNPDLERLQREIQTLKESHSRMTESEQKLVKDMQERIEHVKAYGTLTTKTARQAIFKAGEQLIKIASK